jgi:hypothetical protein
LYLKRALFGKNGYLEWCACELPKGKCSSLQQQFQKKNKEEWRRHTRSPPLNFSSAGVLFMT